MLDREHVTHPLPKFVPFVCPKIRFELAGTKHGNEGYTVHVSQPQHGLGQHDDRTVDESPQ